MWRVIVGMFGGFLGIGGRGEDDGGPPPVRGKGEERWGIQGLEGTPL